ncbi:MAG: flavodoxin-dependent (E)-4-hydroxy-3-methylbut-2-enyl-diphosphate synthase [Rickettsiaceae bacterium H1]|nr:flavodoxin-dependent (E)-4-hydroxy-3-methylbut-2-enyl-diphosphate synthase [Rickettsiaceae bacterium H1]
MDVIASVKDFLQDELYYLSEIPKSKTKEVRVGEVKIGGENPIVIQSMTSGMRSDPKDVLKIAADESKEAIELASAGSQLVRIALNSDKAAMAIPRIRENLDKAGFESVPIVGCGQYELERILQDYPDCTKSLGKIRINPGNVGFGEKRDKKFEKVIEFACEYDMPVRIGVNWGSLDKDLSVKLMDENARLPNPKSSDVVLRKALVASSLLSAKKAEEIGLPKNKIIISCKVSRVQDLICVYSALAKCSDYALHLGLTEAGLGSKGIVGTTAGFAVLLQNGIGNTIRASLTPRPGEARSNEVKVCQEIVQALGLRYFVPQITSCPGCGRTNSTYFQELADRIEKYLAIKMPSWRGKYFGVEKMNVAVMGCIVNGPGESKHADIGISLPGYGEKPIAAVFIDGKLNCRLKGDNLVEDFENIIANYVEKKYA